MNWKSHIEIILPKLSSACFAMRSIKPFVSQQMLKTIYYSKFHMRILYGLIFWGNSSYSARVFGIQKRMIRIMAGRGTRDSCRKLFGYLDILPLPSLYIFSILCFFKKNKKLFYNKQWDTRTQYTTESWSTFPYSKLKKVSIRRVLHGC